MTPDMPPSALTERPAWKALSAHQAEVGPLTLRDLFAADPQRGVRFTLEAAGLYLDYSKQRIDLQTVLLLTALARDCGLHERTAAMFRGERINASEQRAALHVALRAPVGECILLDGVNVVPEVHAVLKRMATFSDDLRSGRMLGHTGEPIRHIVNIGIGGSDLGPAMAHEALRHYASSALQIRFVSNVDSTDLVEATRGLSAAQTLFIVCSKSFLTPETLFNAHAARAWCLQQLGDEHAVARHFVAVSSAPERVARFGIAAEHTFPMWNWVGGRTSLASAVGLSTMVAIGPAHFAEMLAGMRAMDEHFRSMPFERNMPALLGLLAVWNNNVLGASTQAVLPYERYLLHLPAYLQQLMMESNGKRVTEHGQPVGVQTSPIVWGATGTNGQHSFHQLLHQGTRVVPCDFIGFAQGLNPLGPAGQPDEAHDWLMANLFAQAEAMAFGKTDREVRAAGVSEASVPHRVLEGNRPSNIILGERLTPFSLGALVALYEHSVFTQSVVWGIDAFDQWGVELGKEMAQHIAAELQAEPGSDRLHDSSTQALINRYRATRGR
jgi:glucose-6-phosphate isomerase